MASEDKDGIIPEQRIGSKLDTDHQFQAVSEAEAKKIFEMAVARLLHPNVWQKICGPLSANFALTDSDGNNIVRAAKQGDHFRIDVPGPGPSAGDGFDWVQVEAIDDQRRPDAAEESVTIRVRPVPSPANPNPDTAHFFRDDATSSFRVVRNGTTVRAEVHGRNEVPNTTVEKPADKVRNAVVGGGAVAGASKPQWKALVKGLLDTSIKVDVAQNFE